MSKDAAEAARRAAVVTRPQSRRKLSNPAPVQAQIERNIMPTARSRSAAVAVSLTAIVASVATVGTAQAADPLIITCTANATQYYSPGLTLVDKPTNITASATYSCLGGGSVNTAQLSFDYTVDAGCLPTTSPVTTGITRLDWNEGPDSEITSTFVVTRPVGQTIATTVGTVTSGQFSGYIVNQTGVYPALDLLSCLAPGGVTSSQGILSLTLTQPF